MTAVPAVPVVPAVPARLPLLGRAWQAYVAVGAALTATYLLVPASADVLYVVLAASSVVGVVLGARLHLDRKRAPWWLFAAGLAAWTAGDLALAVLPQRAGQVTADVVYLLGYPLLALGVHLLVRARAAGRDTAAVIDAVTVTAALAVLAWVFLGSQVVADPAFGRTATTVKLVFLLGDLVLAGGLVRLAMSATAWSASLRLLVAALALIVVGDVVDLAASVAGNGTANVVDTVYLVSYVLWGAAALHPSMAGLSRPGDHRRFAVRIRLALAGVCGTLPVAYLGVQTLVGQEPQIWAVLIGTAVIIGLLMGRQQLAFDGIEQVTRQTLELQEQLTHEATHDALTQLPNRAHGLRLLEQALARTARERGTVTVMFLDLDGFKLVNDALGHRAGDQLLRRVAERLTRSVRERDVAIRLGGDEFVLVLQSLDGPATALQVAQRVIDAISTPVHLSPQGVARVGVSIGIAQCVDGATDAATLLNEADVAAYRAKTLGKGRAELFDAELRSELLDRERLAAELRTAIDGDQLELDYQPVVDSMSGEVRGYEVLVRWQHPTRGRLLPGDFLPVAESSELICDLDRWVLHHATAQMQHWVDAGRVDGPVVAVNISVVTAARTRLVNDVADALAASGLQPDRLVLELPERVLADIGRTVEHLRAVRALGVSISVADFGSGVGALARLAELPVNVVKIGRSTLDAASPLSDELLRLVIQGAHAVGLHAVAEGVERDEQLAVLRTLDCEMVQGFHIARPMPAADVPAYQRSVSDRFSDLLP